MHKTNKLTQCDIEYQYPIVLMETCKAIQQQGANKGKQCWRPPSENSYCGKHQTVASIEKAKEDSHYKCSTHRCTNTISSNKYCQDCVTKKTEAKSTLCKGNITQGPNKGNPCDKEASTPEGYCGKHTLNILVNKASENGKRICDDGKRACKNYTVEGKLKCEDCLMIIREKEREQHKQLKETGKCLGCGSDIEEKTSGFRRADVQRCQACYDILKEVETRRTRHRNYNEERKANIQRHYQEYITSANKRCISFDVSIEEFATLVGSECAYCRYYNESEVIGIDRVDNSIGYITSNVVGCCSVCNRMKNTHSLEFFKEHVRKLYHTMIEDEEHEISEKDEEESIKKTSYLRPKIIVTMYYNKRLDDYIQLCIEDQRSPLFIDKIRELKGLTLNEVEVRKYVKNVIKSHSNSSSIEIRSRVSQKELLGFLKLKNIDKCIETYSRVHGEPAGFRNDIEELAKNWQDDDEVNERSLKRIIIKYQNKRNTNIK
uniref:Uncharacterized protein n=1 Tax=viral metagenome TaxID=1070528 RepID=A0A6C0I7D7_9ZZZZ